MARSKHGRQRRRDTARSTAHSHRTRRRSDRRAERRAKRRTSGRIEEHSHTERHSHTEEHSHTGRHSHAERHIVAEVEPLDVDGVRTVAIGSVAWIVAFVAMLPFIGTLRDHDRLPWLWICIAGFGLGLIGVEYCRRRRNQLADEPGRRRTESSRFGAAGS